MTATVGKKIKLKRKELGVNQYELGRLLGCTQQMINNYEVGFCGMPINYEMLVYVSEIR